MAVVIPASCGGGGSDDDIPQPTPIPTPTPQPPVNVDPISGLNNLRELLQVDKEVNLLSMLTFATGVELTKTEILFEGQRTEIADPKHFAPEYPGTCSLIFTIKKDGTTSEVKAENLTIKALEYKAIALNTIKPSDILPILKQAEGKADVRYLDVIKLAEAVRIREMMWQYGAGNHSPEQYQELMLRLNTGMMAESPIWYDNFETIGNDIPESQHAHNEWKILNSLIDHASLKVISGWTKMCSFAKDNPDKIIIIGLSMNSDVKKEQYKKWDMDSWKDQLKMKNLILLWAWTNIKKKDWTLINKIYQEKYDLPDEHSIYTSMSAAHSKNDNRFDIHILLTIWTNADGDIDQTNEIQDENSSKFPVGFHDKVLFSGRSFPYTNSDEHFQLENWKYATSYTNYTNVAMMSICFQLFAEVKDVDELLDMVRSTALTDYIRFDLNGDGDTDDEIDGQPETQPLQLMNPAGFILKYLMPTVPTSIKLGETIDLGRGYYHGIIFDIPGAEVKVNGQWIAFTEKNKATILAQNPFALEWRLNADTTNLRKLGYKSDDTLKGKVIVIDDQYNALNITQEISIKVTE